MPAVQLVQTEAESAPTVALYVPLEQLVQVAEEEAPDVSE